MNRAHLPNRRSVRLQQFDYGSSGAYFITSCSQNHQCVFGEIRNGIICLNDLGSSVWSEWFISFEKRTEFSPGAFIVMPNHWHAIVHINRKDGDHWNDNRIEAFGTSKKDTLATMIKGMKSAVTSYAIDAFGWQGKLWQRGFHDHVIRNEPEYYKIEHYILNNVRSWRDDCYHQLRAHRVCPKLVR